jgi:hypothetical protein
MPKKTDAIKISFTADMIKGELEARIVPKQKRGVMTDIKPYLNVMLSSVKVGLTAILADLPVLRPASKNEVEAKAYIFKDEKNDNALYVTRKAIYQAVADVFNSTLKDLFPDVEFINQAITHQQLLITEMKPQEAEEHKRFIKDLAEEVREEVPVKDVGIFKM